MKFLKRNQFTNRAQAIAEFAIALPILLLILYGLIETGRLLFVLSSVNTATRQAVRYGSTTGIGPNGVQRFEDCAGIRAAAQSADFLNAFDDSDITITYDTGNAAVNTYDTCDGSGIPGGSATIDNIPENPGMRVTVSINADFTALMPNIVPFLSRTVAGGNPIQVDSSRTLLQSVEVLPELDDSTTTIDSVSPSPSEVGETVIVTVTVSGPTLTPTGSVVVTADDGTICSPSSIDLVSGTGYCEMTFLTTGTKNITAVYAGDSDHNPSSSDPFSHTVNKASTTITITADTPDPSIINEPFTVSVSVIGGVTTPTGTVDITGTDVNCTITLAGGTGSCNAEFSTDGTKTITATYNGDADHATSSDTELHDVIKDDQTVTTITSDNPDPSQAGQSVTVAVTVSGTTTPTGSVNITTSEGPTCTITLSGGSGSCNVTFSSVGAKTIFATYSGDATHLASSDSEPHSVSLPFTTTTITAHTPNPANVGQPVAVTVTVTGGASTPTGTVQITGAGTNCTITLASGTGSCTVIFNSSGAKTLSATYSGDATHATSSGTASHTVISIPPVSGCNSTNITTGSLQLVGGSMTMSITNNTTSALAISDITVTWNHDKGHQTGSDKSLRFQGASIAGTNFWTGDQAGATYTIVPATTTYVPASATSLFVFTFHQSYDNKDSTESVTLSFSNPGCEGFTITQN